MEIIYSTVVEHTSTVQIQERVEAEEASSARPFLLQKTPRGVSLEICARSISKETCAGRKKN